MAIDLVDPYFPYLWTQNKHCDAEESCIIKVHNKLWPLDKENPGLNVKARSYTPGMTAQPPA